MLVSRAADLRTVHDFPYLLIVLDFFTRTLGSVFIVYLAGRTFLRRGAPELLLLGCGVAIWGSSGLIATSTLSIKDANLGPTIGSLGLWMAALCFLTGVVVSHRSKEEVRAVGAWLGAGYALALVAVGLVALAAFAGRLPVFFVEGEGGTIVRSAVLVSTLAMLVLTAVLLRQGTRPSPSAFAHWYSLSLLLIGAAVLGMMAKLSRSSVLNWACITAQYISGLYMLTAAIAALRNPGGPNITLMHAADGARHRYGVAVATVLAATAARLAFLQALGNQAPFVMFFPVVILTALYGGMRAGLLAAALSALATDYFWIDPPGFGMLSFADWLAMAIFLATSVLISWITEAMQRAQARMKEAQAQAISAVERAQASEALRHKDAELGEAQRIAHIGSWHWDAQSDATTGSDELLRIYGFDPAAQSMPDFKGQREVCYFAEDWERLNAAVQETARTGVGYELDLRALRNGTPIWVTSRGEVLRDAAGGLVGLHGTVQDITDRKQGEQERENAIRFLRIINDAEDTRTLIQGTVGFFRELSGCEAVGVRLRDNDDFPYYEAHGFPEEFVLLENSLCTRCENGQALRDDSGNLVLDCMCGNVICGRFDPNQSYFTPAGSFWTGSTTAMLASTTEADRQARTRNRCNGEGYESVALIALRSGNDTLGLLQLNDRRKDMFTAQDMASWERLAGHLAVAAAKFRAEGGLRESEERFRLVAQSSSDFIYERELKTGQAQFFGDIDACLGYASGEFPRTLSGWVENIHPDDIARVMEAVGKESLEGKPYNMEYRLRRKDGTYADWWDRGVLITDAERRSLKNVGAATDITARKQFEGALRESEERFRLMANAMPQLAWTAHADGYIFWYNQRWYEYTGTTPAQMEGWGWQSVHDPVLLPEILERWKASIATGDPFDMEFPLRGADGTFRPFLTRGIPLKDAQGRIMQWFGTNTDITARKQFEEQIQASLLEKEVLLREIHHRVKNNLQVISSLVNLQTDGIDSPAMRAQLQDVRDRVRSMALVHEKLYQSENLSQVDFGEYARSLLSYLWRAHGSAAAAIKLTLDLQPLPLSAETAVPCGLILNELATNALKHAFCGRSEGEVRVALHLDADGRVRLSVRDNGVGLPPGFDWRQSRSLGLKLVHMLAGQLNGGVEMDNDGGTEFVIRFGNTEAGKPGQETPEEMKNGCEEQIQQQAAD